MKIKPLFKKYRHILLLLYIPIYLIAFYFIEEEIVSWTDNYWVSYVPLDDKIPFCEWFVIPYVLWYPFMGVTGLYLFFADADAFRRYMWFVIIGFSSSLIFYIIFPNGQNLRPSYFENDNILTQIMAHIYRNDTNTNVLPSMHCIGSVAVFLSFLDCEKLRKRKWLVASSGVLAVLICLSTCFCKQHSVLDVFWAMVWCVVIYIIVYVYMRRHMLKKKQNVSAEKPFKAPVLK